MTERGTTEEAVATEPAKHQPRVLVIEDDELVRAEIAVTLFGQGFEVTEAENGRAGLWRLWDGRPDVILCDLLMPVMDGLEVLEAIRNRPEWATIPVVFLTSCDDRASMRRVMEAGADDYVTKPLVPRELVSALRAVMDKQGRFKSEAAQRLDDFRTTLTLALPHEFRTPLDVIFGYAEVLVDLAGDGKDKELSAIATGISNAARQLNRITENFMLWTQLAALRPDGDMETLIGSDEPVALDLVAGTAARERAELAGRSADLTCDLGPAPSYVRRDLLVKIAVELIDNAFKFSPAGSPVRVSTACRGGRSTLTVTDRGEGMPPEKYSIEPEHGFVPTEQGVGLGLAIVRRVVDMAGGQVTVEAEPDGGTMIVVSLPATKP
jgi:signal transduction histidine kinase